MRQSNTLLIVGVVTLLLTGLGGLWYIRSKSAHVTGLLAVITEHGKESLQPSYTRLWRRCTEDSVCIATAIAQSVCCMHLRQTYIFELQKQSLISCQLRKKSSTAKSKDLTELYACLFTMLSEYQVLPCITTMHNLNPVMLQLDAAKDAAAGHAFDINYRNTRIDEVTLLSFELIKLSRFFVGRCIFQPTAANSGGSAG